MLIAQRPILNASRSIETRLGGFRGPMAQDSGYSRDDLQFAAIQAGLVLIPTQNEPGIRRLSPTAGIDRGMLVETLESCSQLAILPSLISRCSFGLSSF